MSKELVLRWKSGSGGGVAEVWNLYGPTETTVDVCGGRADLREDRWAMVSIGRAFGGTLLRLGKGAGFGRLLIGGKSVGAGYKNLAARSRAAFVYDAQQGANDGSSQCYDSGDRARFGASGELEYEGRGDEQVKVSGQRVELGGVESAVLGCEGVRGCCVVVWKGGLVAFVVGRKDGVLEGVRRKVARHEVPHRVVEVEAIPLTTSGKADRAALLRSLEQQQCCPVSAVQDQLFAKVKRMVEDCLGVAELGESLLDRAFEGLGVSVDVIDGWVQREFGCKVQDLRQFSVTSLSRWLDQKPRAEKTTEEREPLSVRAKVKMLMEETLGQKIVDESRSFWELGGSSLQGMELVARLRRECGNSVGIASLMQDSSIDGIFSRVKGNGQVMPASFCKTLCVVGSPAKRGFHSATAGQEGLFVIWKQDPSATNYVVAGRVPHVAGLSSAEVERAVVNTVARHGALQTKRFLYAGAMLLQEVGAEVSWEWWGAVEREEEGWAGVRAVGRTAFNLESGEVGGVLRVRSWEGET